MAASSEPAVGAAPGSAAAVPTAASMKTAQLTRDRTAASRARAKLALEETTPGSLTAQQILRHQNAVAVYDEAKRTHTTVSLVAAAVQTIVGDAVEDINGRQDKWGQQLDEKLDKLDKMVEPLMGVAYGRSPPVLPGQSPVEEHRQQKLLASNAQALAKELAPAAKAHEAAANKDAKALARRIANAEAKARSRKNAKDRMTAVLAAGSAPLVPPQSVDEGMSQVPNETILTLDETTAYLRAYDKMSPEELAVWKALSQSDKERQISVWVKECLASPEAQGRAVPKVPAKKRQASGAGAEPSKRRRGKTAAAPAAPAAPTAAMAQASPSASSAPATDDAKTVAAGVSSGGAHSRAAAKEMSSAVGCARRVPALTRSPSESVSEPECSDSDLKWRLKAAAAAGIPIELD